MQLSRFWHMMKVSRQLRLGPITLHFSFRRHVPVSRGFIPFTSEPGAVSVSSAYPAIANESAITNDGVSESTAESALIVGVGPGFGYALARSLAVAGIDLALACRRPERLEPLVTEITLLGRRVVAFGQDATDERSVDTLFSDVQSIIGIPSLVVYSLQEFCPGFCMDISVPAFESSWRHNCFGAFLVCRAAARAMIPRGHGTILLIGSTSSVIGRENHLTLAVGKFGQRALAQVLSRELWSKGIHVAHVLIDADVSESSPVDRSETCSDPDDIAQALIAVHRQLRTAWSSELDIRPWNERFWEHC